MSVLAVCLSLLSTPSIRSSCKGQDHSFILNEDYKCLATPRCVLYLGQSTCILAGKLLVQRTQLNHEQAGCEVMLGHRFSREWSLDSHLKGQKSALLFCILSKVNHACQTHKYLQSSEFNKCPAPQASLFRSLGLVYMFSSGCLEILPLSALHEAPPVTAQVYLREQRETLLLLLSSQGQGHFSATILA